MSFWVCCNSCFLCPSADRKLAVTTCGHVICSVCYQKGNPGKCLICSSKCQVSALSEKSSAEVKALFSDINSTATRHFTEISKVLKFQSRHQKRILAYYQQKNKKLDEVLVKMRQEMQQMTEKLNEQRTNIAKLKNSLQQQRVKQASSVPQMSRMSQTPHGHKAVLQMPYTSPVSLSRHASVSNMTENMEVDEGSLFRKPVPAPRLSFIASPQDGTLGPGCLSSQRSACSATVSRFQGASLTPSVSYSQTPAWKSPIFKPLSSFRHSMSSPVCPSP
ncbi:putative E3 SUMO-protein ligase RNF212 [Salarias fasciatus]|uniref:putative E3 SUMO-protein ligase RNF212 n=1 Tax=Salarias fasciatus TaxID=181472 RepID=UPI001176AB16|nr:probable E3 SUMO-protein ligase RNF212 [Salarias fasciatus]